jgi:hypothetical protein
MEQREKEEADRLAKEKEEADRLAKEMEEKEQREKEEADRLAKEMEEKEQREKEEADRLAKEKEEKERERQRKEEELAIAQMKQAQEDEARLFAGRAMAEQAAAADREAKAEVEREIDERVVPEQHATPADDVAVNEEATLVDDSDVKEHRNPVEKAENTSVIAEEASIAPVIIVSKPQPKVEKGLSKPDIIGEKAKEELAAIVKELEKQQIDIVKDPNGSVTLDLSKSPLASPYERKSRVLWPTEGDADTYMVPMSLSSPRYAMPRASGARVYPSAGGDSLGLHAASMPSSSRASGPSAIERSALKELEEQRRQIDLIQTRTDMQARMDELNGRQSRHQQQLEHNLEVMKQQQELQKQEMQHQFEMMKQKQEMHDLKKEIEVMKTTQMKQTEGYSGRGAASRNCVVM